MSLRIGRTWKGRFDVLPKMLDPTWIVRLYREGERNPGGTLQPLRAR